MGDWDNADSHYRYHSQEKVNIVGIQPRSEQSDFWRENFAGLVRNPIPSVIDTSHLHQPPKGRKNYNRVQPSYSDFSAVVVPMKMTVMPRGRNRDSTYKTKTRAKSWAPSQPDSTDRPIQPIQRRHHVRPSQP
jgi:hypothetical protein